MAKLKRSVVGCIIFCMIVTCMPVNLVRAAGVNNTMSVNANAVEKKYLYTSSDTFSDDRVRMQISSNQIKLEGTTEVDARVVNFYLRNADDTNDNVKYCETKVDISNRTYNADIDLNNLSRDGNYYVIMRLDDSWDTYFRDLMLRKESGDVFFVSNTDILSNNERIREEGNKVKPESYLDVSLKDDYIYDGALSKDQIEELRTFTSGILSGVEGDYQKLKVIYKYLGDNIYYDNQGASTSVAVTDVYKLYQSLNAGKKTKTVCDGYAGLFVEMSRLEGIPARLVQGVVMQTPDKVWGDMNLNKINHTWVEAYVDGRWIIVDPTRSTTKRFDKDSTGAYTWIDASNPSSKLTGTVRYIYFDPSIESFSNAYYYHRYRNGALDGEYLSDSSEVNKLKAFLGIADNGKNINSAYSPDDISTWYNSKENDDNNKIQTDGFGNATYIAWAGKNLSGNLDVSEFNELKTLLVYNNKITNINAEGDTNLVTVSANANNISKADFSDSTGLKYLGLQKNPLKTAAFIANGHSIDISTTNGTFDVVYDGRTNTKTVAVRLTVPSIHRPGKS